METSTTNLEQPPQKSNKQKSYKSLLNSYLPINERTWNYAIPTIGFSLSCFSFGMFLSFAQDLKQRPIFNYEMYNYGYLVLAGGATVDLYYGLTERRRRQFFFWIFLKIIEALLIAAGVIMEFSAYQSQLDFAIGGIAIFVTDILLLTYVIKRSTKRERVAAENVYAVPNASQFNVSVY